MSFLLRLLNPLNIIFTIFLFILISIKDSIDLFLIHTKQKSVCFLLPLKWMQRSATLLSPPLSFSDRTSTSFHHADKNQPQFVSLPLVTHMIAPNPTTNPPSLPPPISYCPLRLRAQQMRYRSLIVATPLHDQFVIASTIMNLFATLRLSLQLNPKAMVFFFFDRRCTTTTTTTFCILLSVRLALLISHMHPLLHRFNRLCVTSGHVPSPLSH